MTTDKQKIEELTEALYYKEMLIQQLKAEAKNERAVLMYRIKMLELSLHNRNELIKKLRGDNDE